MDALDREILTRLADDARLPYAQLAKELDVATATVHQRVRRLRERGVIKGFHVDLDWVAIGLPVAAVISINSRSERSLDDLARDLATNPYVTSCVAVTGEFDLFVTVRARSSQHLGRIVDQIRILAQGSTRTVVVLTTYFLDAHPPLDDPDTDV